ncbi:HAD family phosphatase [Pseudaeromonas paramecii]|uniref:HAD family phosphatase n=1 Tax=Pseudaeromonas paramecii TaxID=2138166 RepID=A0ABP8QK53_9GAMM
MTRLSCQTVQAVIFDMDGVLVDSEPLYMRVERQSFARHGVFLAPADQDRFVGTSQRQMWQTIRQEYGLEAELDTLIAEHQQAVLAALRQQPLPAMPGVADLLAALAAAGKPCALASSSPRALVETMLETIGLSTCFSQTVCGDEVRLSKPEPDIFLQAADRLGVAPAHCLVIEDSAHGVTAAKAAGMPCIGLQNPNSGNQSLAAADWCCHSHEEIYQQLLRGCHV